MSIEKYDYEIEEWKEDKGKTQGDGFGNRCKWIFQKTAQSFRWCEYLLCSNGQTGEKTGNKKIPVW